MLVLHGGPGSASSARLAAVVPEQHWRIIRFDQRGCGQSTPLGATHDNDTDALMNDIEALRATLCVDKWLLTGGSWGAALALAYAARHKRRVAGLLLRAPFLTDVTDVEAFFTAGGSRCNTEFLALQQALGQPLQSGVVAAINAVMQRDGNFRQQWRVASAWACYEARMAQPDVCPPPPPPFGSAAAQALAAKYRVQAHYLVHSCFLGKATLLSAARKLSDVPVAIVQGDADAICPPANAEWLHAACAGSRLLRVPHAGHDPYHPAMLDAVRKALECFRKTGDFIRLEGCLK